MTDCCMDIEKIDTSIVAAMLLQDDLHNYSEVANLASLLEGGGPYMAKAMESYLNFVDPRVVSFASFALPDSADLCAEQKDVVYLHEIHGTYAEFEEARTSLNIKEDAKLVKCLDKFLAINQSNSNHDQPLYLKYIGETSRTANIRFEEHKVALSLFGKMARKFVRNIRSYIFYVNNSDPLNRQNYEALWAGLTRASASLGTAANVAQCGPWPYEHLLRRFMQEEATYRKNGIWLTERKVVDMDCRAAVIYAEANNFRFVSECLAEMRKNGGK
jgi:hypothetical protein